MQSALHDYFFAVTLLAVLYGVFELLSPFAGAILTAIVCAVSFYPWYERLHRWLPNWKPSPRAALAVSMVFGAFVIPLCLLLWAMISESASLGPAFQQWRETMARLRQGQVTGNLSWLQPLRFFLIRTIGMSSSEFRSGVTNAVSKLFDTIALLGAEWTKHSIVLAFDLVIFLFVLFFLFRDGTKHLKYVYDLVPMRQDYKAAIRKRIHGATLALTRGLLLTTWIQAVAAMIGYFIVGTPGAVLLGALTGVAGVVPVLGTGAIWFPVGLAFLLQGNYWQGAVVLAWGSFVVVGLIDTILRPYLIGRNSDLPTYALFFALIGGIKVWGAKGIIIGPLLVSIAPIVLDIYRERYQRASAPDQAS